MVQDIYIVPAQGCERQEFLNQAQKYVVEQAYNLPMYAAIQYIPLHKRVNGAVWSSKTNRVCLDDAWFEE